MFAKSQTLLKMRIQHYQLTFGTMIGINLA
jgi:hypothetical protein